MFEALLKIAGVVALYVPPALLLMACVWMVRDGAAVTGARRRAFVAGVMASSVAYASHFVLRWYVRRAHLSYWAGVDTVVGVGGLMFLAAMVGLVGSAFGKGYGRVTACIASVLVAAIWWFTGVTTR